MKFYKPFSSDFCFCFLGVVTLLAAIELSSNGFGISCVFLVTITNVADMIYNFIEDVSSGPILKIFIYIDVESLLTTSYLNEYFLKLREK